jgi:hypothetical protein
VDAEQVVEATTANGLCTIRVKAQPLPSQLASVLDAHVEVLRRALISEADAGRGAPDALGRPPATAAAESSGRGDANGLLGGGNLRSLQDTSSCGVGALPSIADGALVHPRDNGGGPAANVSSDHLESTLHGMSLHGGDASNQHDQRLAPGGSQTQVISTCGASCFCLQTWCWVGLPKVCSRIFTGRRGAVGRDGEERRGAEYLRHISRECCRAGCAAGQATSCCKRSRRLSLLHSSEGLVTGPQAGERPPRIGADTSFT